MRVEHDSMGEVLVPAGALWGAQTQRAVENFPVSGERIGRDMIGGMRSIRAKFAASLGGSHARLSKPVCERQLNGI